MRRMLLGGTSVRVKRYSYQPTETKSIIEIPVDFEPHTILIYDRYIAENFIENGITDFGLNTIIPIFMYDKDCNALIEPWSTTGSQFHYKDVCVSYENNIVTIDISKISYKGFSVDHEYKVFLIGELEEDTLS